MSLIVTSSQHYKNIANAIREKSGKEALIVPAKMAEEIRSLPDNPLELLYTKGAEITPEDWGNVNFKGTSSNASNQLDDNLSTIFMDAKCKKISFPDTQTYPIGFYDNKSLEEYNSGNNMKADGKLGGNGQMIFRECSKLKRLIMGENFLPRGSSSFYGCNSLNEVRYKGTIDKWAEAVTPGRYVDRENPFGYSKAGSFYLGDSTEPLTEINITTATTITAGAFYGFKDILKAVLGDSVSTIAASGFCYCSNLNTVILKGDTVKTLSNISAFNNTPIANGTGTIYIQSLTVDEATLVAEYKAATNWSTFANIKPFSEYIE